MMAIWRRSRFWKVQNMQSKYHCFWAASSCRMSSMSFCDVKRFLMDDVIGPYISDTRASWPKTTRAGKRFFYSSAHVLKNSPSSFKRIIEHSSLAATVFMRMRLSRCFIVNGKSFVCCAFPRRSKVCEIGFDWWGARQYKISYFPHLLFSRHLNH